jgi:TonB family protein
LLPSDDQDDERNLLKFSFASEIVELVVFSTDDAFLQTLREAVGNARRIWHVPSADKVCDLLLAGQVGILVLDVQALAEDVGVFVAQIKRQFPDLVLVVAGSRDAETSLANLISAGTVYRFIHKPMSPGRAKLFAEAAVKKYAEQRRRVPPAPTGTGAGNQRLLKIAAAALLAAAILAWAMQHYGASVRDAPPRAVAVDAAPAPGSSSAARTEPAIAANRLIAQDDDEALNLYLQALARDPADAAARTGLAEVQERLWTRAEKSLLEERLDEAATAIDTARKAGVDGGRIALLTARLAKSRERLRSTAHARTPDETRPEPGTDDGRRTKLLSLAEARIREGRLIDPENDSARFYVQEALRIDPDGNSVQSARQTLATTLLAGVRADLDRRDFDHASRLLDATAGIGSAANVENTRQLLNAARRQAETDAWDQLLKTGRERLQQDRLVEPAADSAKYYLMTLRGKNPGNAGLASALQDLGQRLVANARRALDLKQYDAAHNWLDEAAAVGFSSAESGALSRELETVVNQQKFLASVVGSGELDLVKSVKPLYPAKAQASQTEGWVELDFTVTESGAVKDVAVHAANPPGVFDSAAIGALSQWRYKPVLKDAKPVALRSRIRMRFTLPSTSTRPRLPGGV